MGCSLVSHAKGYEVSRGDLWLSAATIFSGLPYAKRHWELANRGVGCSLNHRAIAVIQAFPVMGALAALIERTAILIFDRFFRKPKTSLSTTSSEGDVRPFVPLLPPPILPLSRIEPLPAVPAPHSPSTSVSPSSQSVAVQPASLSSEQNFAKLYWPWAKLILQFEEFMLEFIENIASHIDRDVDEKFEANARAAKKKGHQKRGFLVPANRSKFEQLLGNMASGFASFKALKQSFHRYHSIKKSRFAYFNLILTDWVSGKKETTLLFLSQLESCNRYVYSSHSALRLKIEDLIQETQRVGSEMDSSKKKGLELAASNLKQLSAFILSINKQGAELQEGIDRLRSIQSAVLPDRFPHEFLFELEDHRELTNPHFPRCKPVVFDTSDWGDDDQKDDIELVCRVADASVQALSSTTEIVVAPTLSGLMQKSVVGILNLWSLDKLTREEVRDHILLATQGIEMLTELAQMQRYDLFSVCLHSYLLDSYIALEQVFKQGDRTHGLVQLSVRARWNGAAQQQQFLQDHNIALLWARYPAYYASCYAYGNAPPPVAWFSRLKNEGSQVVGEVIESYKTFLSIISKKNVPPFILELIPPNDIPPFFSTTENDSSKAAKKYRQLRETIEKAIDKAGHLEKLPDGNPLIHLKEVCWYLMWMEQAIEIRHLFPDPKWTYWCTRVFLNTDKLFKHLMTADCLINERGLISEHNLRRYIEALEGVRSFSEQQLGIMTAVNIGIGHHYINVADFPLSATCRKMLKQSEKDVSLATGFMPVGKRNRAKTTEVDALLEKAFDLFVHLTHKVLANKFLS